MGHTDGSAVEQMRRGWVLKDDSWVSALTHPCSLVPTTTHIPPQFPLTWLNQASEPDTLATRPCSPLPYLALLWVLVFSLCPSVITSHLAYLPLSPGNLLTTPKSGSGLPGSVLGQHLSALLGSKLSEERGPGGTARS